MVRMNSEAGLVERASQIIGRTVENYEGQRLGEIKDLMINYPDGIVTYAILSSGGLLGLGDKLFAVPWVSLTNDQKNQRFLMKADKELLEKAPGFDKDHWPDMSDPTRQAEIYRYYNAAPKMAADEGTRKRNRKAAD